MEQQNYKKVSIITPIYEEPLWQLKRNIRSVCDQGNKNLEIEHIVVCDNPIRNAEVALFLHELTSKISEEVANYKLVYTHTPENVGLSKARNQAMELATGDYFMLLDTDDSRVQFSVQEQINFMEEYGIDHSYGGYREIHGDNFLPEPHLITPPHFSIAYFLNGQNICYCGSNCFTREVYEKIGGFDENMKEGAEDMEYWIRLHTAGFKSEFMNRGELYYLGVTDRNMTAKLIANGGFERAYKYIKNKYPHLEFTF